MIDIYYFNSSSMKAFFFPCEIPSLCQPQSFSGSSVKVCPRFWLLKPIALDFRLWKQKGSHNPRVGQRRRGKLNRWRIIPSWHSYCRLRSVRLFQDGNVICHLYLKLNWWYFMVFDIISINILCWNYRMIRECWIFDCFYTCWDTIKVDLR